MQTPFEEMQKEECRMQNEKKPHPRSVFDNFELKEKEDDMIPLTPALSPGERETHNPALGTKRSCGLAEDWRTILPLPGGEGRGEGESNPQRASSKIFSGVFQIQSLQPTSPPLHCSSTPLPQ